MLADDLSDHFDGNLDAFFQCYLLHPLPLGRIPCSLQKVVAFPCQISRNPHDDATDSKPCCFNKTGFPHDLDMVPNLYV